MPSDERTTKGAERCDLHPASPSVARCDGCGRPLCLSCATPVRGRVLGAECLADALGPDSPPPDPPPGRARPSVGEVLAGAAFALAVAATFLPWTRFGEGSGLFGAWGRSFRWSMVAAVAAVLGLAVWLLQRALHRPPGRLRTAVQTPLAVLVTVGAALAIVRPPSFTHAWIGPWLALVSGAVALAARLFERRARPDDRRAYLTRPTARH